MKKDALIGPLALLLLWSILHWGGLVRPLFLPSPVATMGSLARLIGSVQGLTEIGWTLGRVLLGFGLACLVGIPTGLMMGRWNRVSSAIGLLVDFFRSLPALAVFPLLMLVFGIGESAKIATTVLSCSLVIVIGAMYGVRQTPPARLIVAKQMGADETEMFTRVVLWDALPHIFAGMRVALSLAVVVIVVTEMFVGTSAGLGYRIFQDQLTYRVSEMYAAIILAGLLGYGLNKAFVAAEHRAVHWVGR
jgi:NitT/TauT family transport system permease protein